MPAGGRARRHVARSRSPNELFGDRVPPHNLDAEQGLLAAIIIDGGGNTLSEAIEKKIRPEYFFSTAHQVIYEAVSSLQNDSQGIDEITLCERLRKNGKLETAGGVVYINEITARTATTAHAGHWIEILCEKYFLRKLISTATHTVERAFSAGGDLAHLIDAVEKDFFEISQDRVRESAMATNQPKGIVDSTLELIDEMRKNRGTISGVPTGFRRLDEMTFGFHPGQMIVVAARPGMGKTSIALNFIEAALFDKHAEKSRRILMFSLEMTAQDLVMRLLAARSRVNLRKIQQGFSKHDDVAKLTQAAVEYKKQELLIDDVGGQTILEIRAKARRLHSKAPLDMILIDYLQLINGTDNSVSREQQIAEASRSIKAMAKEFGIPIVALAQLNRKSEDDNRAPKPSDLRESGSIEQDADVIMLIDIQRGGGKKRTEIEEEEDKQVNVKNRQLIIAKQRNGPTGEIKLHFIGDITRFEPVEENITEPH